jgi:predicted phage-related endonuclease
MKTLKFEDKDLWLAARKTRITGSRLKDIVVLRGNEKKIGFWELLAERLEIGDDQSDNPMQRGTDLEGDAIKAFEEAEGKSVSTDLVIWTRDDNESIAISPDGYIGETEAVECKCLASARHLEAYFNNKVPKDYWFQVLQYFIVNEKLEQLHLVMYDPRIPQKPYFKITIDRSEVQKEVEKYLEYQKKVIDEVNNLANQLSF